MVTPKIPKICESENILKQIILLSSWEKKTDV